MRAKTGILVAAWLAGAAALGGAPETWFDDLKPAPPLKAAEGVALAELAATRLRAREGDAPALPGGLRADEAMRLVFVSASDGTARAHVAGGGGKGAAAALERAATGLTALAGPGFRPTWVKVDVVREVSASPDAIPLSSPLFMDLGRHGVAFRRETGIALLPDEVVAGRFVKPVGVGRDRRWALDNLTVSTYLEKRPAQASAFQDINIARAAHVFLFTTQSFFWDASGACGLMRGHRAQVVLTPATVLAAARAAGAYLARTQADDGKFAYCYWPWLDRDAARYSTRGHCETIAALLDLHEATKDQDALAAARRGIEYLAGLARPMKVWGNELRCIEEDRLVRLGTNALACIALARYAAVTGDQGHLPLARDIARWMLTMQQPNGDFPVHVVVWPRGQAARSRLEPDPYEACAALLRLQAVDKEASWLNAAAKGVQYLAKVRDRDRPMEKLIEDRWLFHALEEAHRLQPDEFYLGHVRRVADAILETQHREAESPELLGGFGDPLTSGTTAARTEALCVAHRLAMADRRADKALALLDAIRLGAVFQLHTQCRPESALHFIQPLRCLGAFRESLTDCELRLDHTQQNLASLLAVHRLLVEQEK